MTIADWILLAEWFTVGEDAVLLMTMMRELHVTVAGMVLLMILNLLWLPMTGGGLISDAAVLLSCSGATGGAGTQTCRAVIVEAGQASYACEL